MIIGILGTALLVILVYFLSIILMEIFNLWLLSKICHLLVKMLSCYLSDQLFMPFELNDSTLVTQTQICITITI